MLSVGPLILIHFANKTGILSENSSRLVALVKLNNKVLRNHSPSINGAENVGGYVQALLWSKYTKYVAVAY